MLKKYAPFLILVLAVVGGYWLLASDSGDDPYAAWDDDPVADEGEGDMLESTGLAAGGRAPEPEGKKKRKPYRTIDPRTLPRGTLYVTPIGPNDKPIEKQQLRIRVLGVRAGAFPTKLPAHFDEETGTYRFDKVLEGEVNVELYADHIQRKVQKVRIRANQDNRHTIAVKPGATIEYDVVAYDKSKPDVRVMLFDAQDKPVKAWYLVRTTTRLTTARYLESINQGPEGSIISLEPGDYRIKVISEAEEWDDAKVTLKAGETKKVSLEVRR